ncbi:Chemotaxis protein methyltransferase CheR [hydrothermal vent metagenome]|uniref:protein-glutamate O-methyltransferase n=1 Tax=hydrothermal vent metagenome TaxID=652676 RepID=A0A3B1CRN7_9ZZZZ
MSKALTKRNLLIFRDFIQIRTGLFFPESRFDAFENVLEAHFKNVAYENFATYISFLKSEAGEGHFKKLISCLTTNETYFFRGKTHFELLEKKILPKIVEREACAHKCISIWSAGCSTGEEPYSIAILLKQLIPQIETWQIEIVATDIDEAALSQAKSGAYSEWSFRGVDSDMMMTAFRKKDDLYHINPAYKSLVRFQRNNLISDVPPTVTFGGGPFDIIFCRNVMIYFDQETIKALASKFHDALKEGGYLIVGDAEHSAQNYVLFKSRTFPAAVIYQKKCINGSGFDVDMPLYPSTSFLKKTQGEAHSLKIKNVVYKTTAQEHERLFQFIHNNKKKKKLRVSEKKLPIRQIKKDTVSLEETRLFNEAMHYYFEKRYEMAIDWFLRIVHMNQDHSCAAWMLSHIASNRGDFEEAIAWSERCIKIDALFKEPYYTLATIYMAKGMLDVAMFQIKKAIYIDPRFILGHFVMGSLYRSMNVSSEAEKCFKRMEGFISKKASDEVIFETEFLALGILQKWIQDKAGGI